MSHEARMLGAEPKRKARIMDMTELIPSRDLREALCKRGRELTDKEMASIIFNRELSPERTRQLLEELASSTQDVDLREQIRFSLDASQQRWDRFCRTETGRIFGVDLIDEDHPEGGIAACFSTFEAARAFGCLQNAPFWVRAFAVHDAVDPDDPPQDDDNWMGVRFSASGQVELVSLFDSALEREQRERWPYGTFFEDRWVDLPNPFERGDVVRVLCKPASYITPAYEWAVVSASPETWNAFSARVRSWLERVESGAEEPRGVMGDYSDVQVTVEFPCSDGTFMHDHINPLYLERAELEPQDDEKELLEMATWAAKHDCSLEWMTTILRKHEAAL